MATYFLFGKYSNDAIKSIRVERTQEAVDLIKNHGGEVSAKYVLLGEHDIVFITDFPGMDNAIKASVGLAKLTGITFSTAPAVTVEEFDKLT